MGNRGDVERFGLPLLAFQVEERGPEPSETLGCRVNSDVPGSKKQKGVPYS